MPVAELAAAAVTVLAPYLKEGATSLAKKLGSTAAERLTSVYEKVKARLTLSGKEALTDLEKAPEDAEAQGAVRLQLKKQLPNDPTLETLLAELVEALGSGKAGQVLQASTIVGNKNVNVQIAGSGNQVSGFGKPS